MQLVQLHPFPRTHDAKRGRYSAVLEYFFIEGPVNWKDHGHARAGAPRRTEGGRQKAEALKRQKKDFPFVISQLSFVIDWAETRGLAQSQKLEASLNQ